jgi:hypothetical protein
MTTRAEHLAWCKSRAIELLDRGDLTGAVASMMSDLGKWSEPLYDQTTLTFLTMDGLMFCKTSDQVRHWIDGFN